MLQSLEQYTHINLDEMEPDQGTLPYWTLKPRKVYI